MPQLLGKEIGSTGYGLMGLTWRPTPPPQEQAFAAMKASLKAGANFWNAGEVRSYRFPISILSILKIVCILKQPTNIPKFYGTPEYNSLTLLNAYFTKYPEDADRVVLSVKGGINASTHQPDGTPEGVKASIENCMRQLDGKKKIDIFECARVDKKTPIETTMKALESHVEKGDIGGIMLSEASAATIEKAAKVTKIIGVEAEFSLWYAPFYSSFSLRNILPSYTNQALRFSQVT